MGGPLPQWAKYHTDTKSKNLLLSMSRCRPTQRGHIAGLPPPHDSSTYKKRKLFQTVGCLRHCSLEASISVILPQINGLDFLKCGLLTTLLIGSQHQRYLASNQQITSGTGIIFQKKISIIIRPHRHSPLIAKKPYLVQINRVQTAHATVPAGTIGPQPDIAFGD